ncbi:hypothetical protein OHA59_47725 [Streptomyces sp. NBC_01589]
MSTAPCFLFDIPETWDEVDLSGWPRPAKALATTDAPRENVLCPHPRA